jgi:flagellar L-ring protein precursor FlgH
MMKIRTPRATLGALVALLAVSGCDMADRLANVGSEPELSVITNPGAGPNRHPNSLWRPGSRAFFKDQRASQVGDILTVVIDIDDNATISNTTQRTRDNSEDASAGNFLGFESQLDRIFPDAIDPNSLIDLDSDSLSQGAGSVDRDEAINLRIAGLVTQVLPNGNYVIAGRQEVRVNFEVRELLVAGIIRPEDLTSQNTINYDQIAEARISYGGRGQITDVQQPRYGQQVYDIIWPF